MNQIEIFAKIRNFTASSLDWCIREAEEGTSRVTAAIDVLLKDLTRVSQMSGDSLKALEKLQSMLHTFDNKNYQQLHKSLAALSQENSDIDAYIQPIMEALQFQDRFRQNLENTLKMIDIWQAKRDALKPEAQSEAALLDLGQALLKVTTMKRERDIVRTHIEGLEPEQVAPSVSFF